MIDYAPDRSCTQNFREIRELRDVKSGDGFGGQTAERQVACKRAAAGVADVDTGAGTDQTGQWVHSGTDDRFTANFQHPQMDTVVRGRQFVRDGKPMMVKRSFRDESGEFRVGTPNASFLRMKIEVAIQT